ncbi:hypothetical protein Tco_0458715 [Tanacetum coccineum]
MKGMDGEEDKEEVNDWGDEGGRRGEGYVYGKLGVFVEGSCDVGGIEVCEERGMVGMCGSIDKGFVASVVGGGVDVDYCGGEVKDGNDCGMMVENTGEE